MPDPAASPGLVDRRARTGVLLYGAAWLLIVGIYLVAFVLSKVPFDLALRNAVANILPDALLGLVILRLPWWLPWPGGRAARFFAAHAALVALFILASTVGWVGLVFLDGLAFGTTPGHHIDVRIIPFRVLNGLLIYGTLAGLGYAWRNAALGREAAARAARAETLRARAELEALRSQLNPHFILNTFHALVSLVRRDPRVAEEALEQLGDLLRYSLRVQRDGLDEVALREEWAFVRSYLDLERLRLGDRLRVSLDAAPAALDCIVPTFALQTLVENSVRHAVAPRAAGGSVAISARQVDGRLRLVVEDEVAEAAAAGPVALATPSASVAASAPPAGPAALAASPPGDARGMGLRLLRERLAALYDGGARLDVAPAPRGMQAVLEIPLRQVEPAP